jgi:hypothetical protein
MCKINGNDFPFQKPVKILLSPKRFTGFVQRLAYLNVKVFTLRIPFVESLLVTHPKNRPSSLTTILASIPALITNL